MNRKPDNLNDALRDIATAPILKSDYERYPADEREPLKAGINFWGDVAPEDFGPSHDFETIDHFDHIVFFPVSKAAIKWANTKLPEHLDRWGSHGYKIPVTEINPIVTAAQRDGLMSESDYNDAMEEANALQHQGVEE